VFIGRSITIKKRNFNTNQWLSGTTFIHRHPRTFYSVLLLLDIILISPWIAVTSRLCRLSLRKTQRAPQQATPCTVRLVCTMALQLGHRTQLEQGKYGRHTCRRHVWDGLAHSVPFYKRIVHYHCGGWSEEVNSCILISYMVYL
jgi:hypothetical protein